MKPLSIFDPSRARSRSRELRLWPEEFDRMRDELDDWFADRFRGLGSSPHPDAFWADMDLSETNGSLEVTLDMPGFKREDIEIDVADNRLTVSGKREMEEKEEGKDFHRIERQSGSFQRSIRLPAEVAADGAQAELKDGVLKVTLPKSEKAKEARRIEIKTA